MRSDWLNTSRVPSPSSPPPLFATERKQTGCSCVFVKCYNKIPCDILKLNERKFKKYIKSTLCKQAYYKLDDYIQDKNAWKHAGPAP